MATKVMQMYQPEMPLSPPTTKTRATKKLLRRLTRSLKFEADVVDVYGPKVCYFWYRLNSREDIDYDLGPERMGEQPFWHVDETSVEPEWWPWWLDDFEIQGALDIGWSEGLIHECGRDWRQPWRKWALEQGIAPGQLFRVEVPAPDVVKSGFETVEYDVEWAASVVEIQPLPRAVAAKRWAHDLRKTTAARAIHVRVADDNARRIDSDVSRMYIQQFMYEPASSHRSWGMPTGRSLRLASKLQLYPVSATCMGIEGRDDQGSQEIAMSRLIEKACAANPRLSPEIIKNLELKR